MEFRVLLLGIIVIGVPVAVFLGFTALARALLREQPGRGTGAGSTTALAGIAGFGIWWIWLSWGEPYLGSSGQWQGPYRPWQVVSCGATMVLVVVLGGFASRWRSSGPFFAAYGATAGFAFAWFLEASYYDDTGLFLVGLVMLLTGSVLGLSLVAGITAGIRNFTYSRTS